MNRHDRNHYAIAALLAALIVALVVVVVTGGATYFGRPSQPAPVTFSDELHAGYAAQATPIRNCWPAPGATAGQCAPTQAFQGLNAAGDLVRDPFSGSAAGLLVPDVSHYTGCPVNAGAMRRDGARGLIVAVGDGYYADPCARANAAAARSAGLPVGYYLFFRPSPGTSPEGQADRLHQLSRAAGGGPLSEWIDAEAGYGLSRAGYCSFFTRAAARIEANTHRVAGVYTGAWWMDPNVGYCATLARSTRYGDRPLWVSGYGIAPLIPLAFRAVRHNGRSYALWQYTGDGLGPLFPHSLGGYGGIDISVYSGTARQFAAFAQTVPPPTAAQFAQCGTLRWLRRHGRRADPATGDLRASLLANRIACPDSKAARSGPPPSLPQPSTDEFRMCRTLLAWRRSGRRRGFRVQAARDRAQLVRSRVSCGGRPPLIALHY